MRKATAPRATKIVATIGPASTSLDILVRMFEAGVDVVRLNFSHGSAADHIARAALVRQAAAQVGREVAIMADLQGPKIRVGKFAGGKVLLEAGAAFVLDAACEMGDQHCAGLDYKDLPGDLHPGDVLLLNDGLIVLEVERIAGAKIHTVVRIGGELSNNKGINRRGGGLTAPALTAKDMDDIVTAMSFQADYLAVSFPKNATDMQMARQLADIAGEPFGHRPFLIAKIERAEAIPALQEILDVSDGIMVARGDLAVEVGAAAVPALQKRMIKLARASNKLSITATQMMESMISNPVPTRAEVSDVANAVLDGSDAVMTSAETASGRYPVETIEAMAAICLDVEHWDSGKLDLDELGAMVSRRDEAIAHSAVFVAEHLGAKVIAALTESGTTPLWMSRRHIDIPILALTPNIATQRRLALYRNVTALAHVQRADPERQAQSIESLLLERGLVSVGDLVVLTWGRAMGASGATDALKVIRVGG